jgi:hypothetical protein
MWQDGFFVERETRREEESWQNPKHLTRNGLQLGKDAGKQ